MADTIEIIDPFQTPAADTPNPAPTATPISTADIPIATSSTTSVVPNGHFPSLANSLQMELNDHLGRSKDAINKILAATREKAEFLESLAEKAKNELEKEKHNISKVMGNIS